MPVAHMVCARLKVAREMSVVHTHFALVKAVREMPVVRMLDAK